VAPEIHDTTPQMEIGVEAIHGVDHRHWSEGVHRRIRRRGIDSRIRYHCEAGRTTADNLPG